ncbi:MAG: oxidative damage protection protein [Bryobacterales bacterium]|nr:oxidative damage protection protein [Bryobacterales bacterium]
MSSIAGERRQEARSWQFIAAIPWLLVPRHPVAGEMKAFTGSRSGAGQHRSGRESGMYYAETMAERMVNCVKLGKELPGLDDVPFDSELGQKIYDNVSKIAWAQWAEHLKMIINEYRLNPATLQAQEMIVKQMEAYFFGEGAAPPPEYVAPGS